MYLVLIEFDYSINLIHLNELILKEFEHLEWNYLINEEYVMMLNSSMNLNSSIDYQKDQDRLNFEVDEIDWGMFLTNNDTHEIQLEMEEY